MNSDDLKRLKENENQNSKRPKLANKKFLNQKNYGEREICTSFSFVQRSFLFSLLLQEEKQTIT